MMATAPATLAGVPLEEPSCRALLQRAALARATWRQRVKTAATDSDTALATDMVADDNEELTCLQRAAVLAMAPLQSSTYGDDEGGGGNGNGNGNGITSPPALPLLLPAMADTLPPGFDVGACFLVHARLARCCWNRCLAAEGAQQKQQQQCWGDQARAAASTALAAYSLAFPDDKRAAAAVAKPAEISRAGISEMGDGEERLDALIQRLTALMWALAAPPARITYSVRALRDVRNGLRMCGVLDATPDELQSYRAIVDVVASEDDVAEAEPCRPSVTVAYNKKKKAVAAAPNSKQRRQEQRRLKFGEPNPVAADVHCESVPVA